MKKAVLDILEKIEYYKRHFVTPEKYIPKIFKKRAGYEPDLLNPKSFNEKLQWLKLHDKNPLYTTLVDKYEVKEYIAQIIGEMYVIPTLGVWDAFEEIDFSTLPNQFVLKCTHDSGGLVICKDKSKLDIKKTRTKIKKSLDFNYYYLGFEWPYKNVKPRIIAETYLEDTKTSELRDYKFFVFNGTVRALFIVTNRNVDSHEANMDFFDENFKHLPFERVYKNAIHLREKPVMFDEMKVLAEKLAKNIPFVRVDFYEVDGHIYFGEMTFYPGCGWEPFTPQSWDYVMGEWLRLPDNG